MHNIFRLSNLNESYFSYKIPLNFSFVSQKYLQNYTEIRFGTTRLHELCVISNQQCFPLPYSSTSIRVVNNYAHCNARLRFFCRPNYQLNVYQQKIRLRIVCKNGNDLISFFDVICVKSLNNEMMSVSVIEKRKN